MRINNEYYAFYHLKIIVHTLINASVIASPATQPDLSSSSQVSSSTQPWKNALPVTVSRHVEGNGWRIVI